MVLPPVMNSVIIPADGAPSRHEQCNISCLWCSLPWGWTEEEEGEEKEEGEDEEENEIE